MHNLQILPPLYRVYCALPPLLFKCKYIIMTIINWRNQMKIVGSGNHLKCWFECFKFYFNIAVSLKLINYIHVQVQCTYM